MSRALAFLSFLLLALPASAGEAELYAQGLEELRRGRYVESLESFSELLYLHPKSAFGEKTRRHIWDVMSRIKEQESSWRLTEGERRDAVKLARERRAAREARRGQVLAELEAVQKKIRENPAGLVEALGRSRLLSDAEEVSAARELEALESQRDLDAILSALKEQIREGRLADPAALHEARAFIWLHEGDLGGAVEEWEQALKHKPGDEALKARLAKAKSDLGRQKLKEEVGVQMARGKARYEAGDEADARESFERVLILSPENAEALRYRKLIDERAQERRLRETVGKSVDGARLALSQGRLLDAVSLLADALGKDPQNEDALRTLAEAKRKLSLKTALAGPPPAAGKAAAAPNRDQAEQAYALGMARYVQDDLDGAIGHFQRALALDDTFEEASGALAAALKEKSVRAAPERKP